MPAVRVIQKILATLLAIQLFAAFGLCGATCCRQAQPVLAAQSHSHAARTDSHANHRLAAKPAMAKGHCHSIAQKTAQSSQREKSSGQSIAITAGQHCQCSISRQESLAASLNQADSSPQKGKQFAFAAQPTWQYVDQTQPSPSVSPPPSLSHAPPFGGYQLHLRI